MYSFLTVGKQQDPFTPPKCKVGCRNGNSLKGNVLWDHFKDT